MFCDICEKKKKFWKLEMSILRWTHFSVDYFLSFSLLIALSSNAEISLLFWSGGGGLSKSGLSTVSYFPLGIYYTHTKRKKGESRE